MKKLNLLLILFSQTFISSITAQVVLTDSSHKNIFGIPSTVYTLKVDANGIETREVRVNAYRQSNSKGAVIVNSGSEGKEFYIEAYGTEAEKTIDTLYKAGLEVYEVKWNESRGWSEHARGKGYPLAVGGFTGVVNFLHENLIDNPDTIIVHGNSGGAIQISFGLELYGLDNIVDVAVLSGGPPISDIKLAVFGNPNNPAYWPNGLSGFALTDFIMGWDGNGDYCVNRSAPDSIQNLLDTVSIVTNKKPRSYNYKSRVIFIEANDPTAADHQAEIYFDSIKSAKEWHFLPELNEHALPEFPEGAAKIREVILEYINGKITSQTEEDILPGKYKLFANYPNPFNPGTDISYQLSESGYVTIKIFNSIGEEVASLVNEYRNTGIHTVNFKGDNLTSGVYYYRISVNEFTDTKKMILLK